MAELPLCRGSVRLTFQWLTFLRSVIVGETRIIVVKKQMPRLHSCRQRCVVVKLAKVVTIPYSIASIKGS